MENGFLQLIPAYLSCLIPLPNQPNLKRSELYHLGPPGEPSIEGVAKFEMFVCYNCCSLPCPLLVYANLMAWNLGEVVLWCLFDGSVTETRKVTCYCLGHNTLMNALHET